MASKKKHGASDMVTEAPGIPAYTYPGFPAPVTNTDDADVQGDEFLVVGKREIDNPTASAYGGKK